MRPDGSSSHPGHAICFHCTPRSSVVRGFVPRRILPLWLHPCVAGSGRPNAVGPDNDGSWSPLWVRPSQQKRVQSLPLPCSGATLTQHLSPGFVDKRPKWPAHLHLNDAMAAGSWLPSTGPLCGVPDGSQMQPNPLSRVATILQSVVSFGFAWTLPAGPRTPTDGRKHRYVG